MTIEKFARKIMMKTKGWKKRDMEDDFRDYPEANRAELKWLIRELEKVQKLPVFRSSKFRAKKDGPRCGAI